MALCRALAAAVIVAIALGVVPAGPIEPGAAQAGTAVVGGSRMNCHAAQVVMSDDVPGPGFATKGVIWLGKKHLKSYPTITQRLIFLHECAHQYVGTDETAADCWAVRIAKRQGWLTAAGVKATCRAIWHTQGGQYHLPGPMRCEKLMQCFADAPSGYGTAKRKTKRKVAGN
jgi:hypothetical protein